jgi:hypothetical protein
VDARGVIEEKIIPGMVDRRKALKLAEALVLAQEELVRCGLDEEEIGSSALLAHQVLAEALLATPTAAGK